MAKQSVLDQIRALDEQKRQLMNDAKREALEKVAAAISELNALGFNYRFGEEPLSRRGTRQINALKPCAICKFQTKPPHDARSHRTQSPKKPFTVKELEERGMMKI